MKSQHLLSIITILYLPFSLIAQKAVEVDSTMEESTMKFAWEMVQVPSSVAFEKILKTSDHSWQIIKDFPYVFNEGNGKVAWVKTELVNKSNRLLNFRILLKGIDSINVYTSEGGNAYQHQVSGKFIPLSNRFVSSSLLVIPITLKGKTSTTVYIRLYNQNYPLALPYLSLLSVAKCNQQIKLIEMYWAAYIGIMFFMLLFSSILLLFFRSRLYYSYLLCLACSIGMAIIYTDMYYLFFEVAPPIVRNKNIFAILTVLQTINYMLFTESFLNVAVRLNRFQYIFSRLLMFLLLALCFILQFQGLALFQYRAIFYILFALANGFMYNNVLKSILAKYTPAWFYFIATMPILIVSGIEITSSFNGVPVQTIHDYYYGATLFELCFLTIAIVYKFSLERTNALLIERELLAKEIEMKVLEVKVQRQEQERIAQDLHDQVGAGIVGVQNRLTYFSEQHFEKVPDHLDKTLMYLEQLSQSIRSIAHGLMPHTLAELGLKAQIIETYGHIKHPAFKISIPFDDLSLEPLIAGNLYKVINEGVNNTIKHAEATEVGIHINEEKGKFLKLRIEDNGKGFDTSKKGEGIGLNNMRYRVEKQLNGSVLIESNRNGTVISIKIPLNTDHPEMNYKHSSKDTNWINSKLVDKIKTLPLFGGLKK